ncbi:hypothetical protein D3Y55_20090 [Mesorhizobium sp. DCY119]|nr:hypothetical protein D3Y55_20090 [Mesorhizobium sp. DCY119]
MFLWKARPNLEQFQTGRGRETAPPVVEIRQNPDNPREAKAMTKPTNTISAVALIPDNQNQIATG